MRNYLSSNSLKMILLFLTLATSAAANQLTINVNTIPESDGSHVTTSHYVEKECSYELFKPFGLWENEAQLKQCIQRHYGAGQGKSLNKAFFVSSKPIREFISNDDNLYATVDYWKTENKTALPCTMNISVSKVENFTANRYTTKNNTICDNRRNSSTNLTCTVSHNKTNNYLEVTPYQAVDLNLGKLMHVKFYIAGRQKFHETYAYLSGEKQKIFQIDDGISSTSEILQPGKVAQIQTIVVAVDASFDLLSGCQIQGHIVLQYDHGGRSLAPIETFDKCFKCENFLKESVHMNVEDYADFIAL